VVLFMQFGSMFRTSDYWTDEECYLS
jgi:hypothetical protein